MLSVQKNQEIKKCITMYNIITRNLLRKNVCQKCGNNSTVCTNIFFPEHKLILIIVTVVIRYCLLKYVPLHYKINYDHLH